MPSKPSRADFLDLVASYVTKKFPLVRLAKDDNEFSIRINGHWTRLENLYRTVAERPDLFEKQVDRWVVELLRAAEGSPDQTAPFDEIKERVLPMLLSKGPRDVAGMAMVSQQVLEDLKVAYVLDSDRTVAYVPRKVFESWKITLEELHETAINNLVSRSEELQANAAQDEQGRVNLVLFQTLDGYDATRVLLPSLHDRLREHLGSPFLAAIPNRDILVCFRNDPAMVKRMGTQVAEDYKTMPHQITDRLLLVTPDGIATYDAGTV